MSIEFGFYNSVNGDRKYDATDFSKLIDAIMEDGVIRSIGTEFQVLSTGGLNITVGIGMGWFDDTYTYNNTVLPMTLGVSEVSNNRYDAIVLETDSSNAVRANTIRIVPGVPDPNPSVPVMTHTATLNQYPLGYIYRAGGSTSVSQANITKAVGTPACPYAVTRLLDRITEPAIMHRQTFRGKYLGTAYTSAQRTAVQNGTFEDLYIGDYWLINGIKWRIADINYYFNLGDPPTLTNHLVVIPDSVIRRGRMNEDYNKGNAGAYVGSDARSSVFGFMLAQVKAAFGETLVTWTMGVSNAMSPQTGLVTSVIWSACLLEIPNVPMMTGTSLFIPASNGSTIPGVSTESFSQLALFRLAPWFIRADNPTDADRAQLLRDPLSTTAWACMGGAGSLTYVPSNALYGFRPYFLLG